MTLIAAGKTPWGNLLGKVWKGAFCPREGAPSAVWKEDPCREIQGRGHSAGNHTAGGHLNGDKMLEEVESFATGEESFND